MASHDVMTRTRASTYANPFRARRLRRFLALTDVVLARRRSCRVLDVGGEVAYWDGLRDVWAGRRLDITIVNIHDDEAAPAANIRRVRGDARDLSRFTDDSFDVVHSNSVIEHVGPWSDRVAMAGEVRRLAPSYFVQTPNFWFPLEPHLRVPGIHWLPQPWRRAIVMSRACGYYPRARGVAEAETILQDATLLDAAAMRALFPEAAIVRERVGPLTKSLIAVRACGADA